MAKWGRAKKREDSGKNRSPKTSEQKTEEWILSMLLGQGADLDLAQETRVAEAAYARGGAKAVKGLAGPGSFRNQKGQMISTPGLRKLVGKPRDQLLKSLILADPQFVEKIESLAKKKAKKVSERPWGYSAPEGEGVKYKGKILGKAPKKKSGLVHKAVGKGGMGRSVGLPLLLMGLIQSLMSGRRERGKAMEMAEGKDPMSLMMRGPQVSPEAEASRAMQGLDIQMAMMREVDRQRQPVGTPRVDALKEFDPQHLETIISKMSAPLWGDLDEGEIRVDGNPPSASQRQGLEAMLEQMIQGSMG